MIYIERDALAMIRRVRDRLYTEKKFRDGDEMRDLAQVLDAALNLVYEDGETERLREDDRDDSPIEFGESPQGYVTRERWARNYDELNGAPEGEWDR